MFTVKIDKDGKIKNKKIGKIYNDEPVMRQRLKMIGTSLFYELATVGIIDMVVNAWTGGSVRLIHRFLRLFCAT